LARSLPFYERVRADEEKNPRAPSGRRRAPVRGLRQRRPTDGGERLLRRGAYARLRTRAEDGGKARLLALDVDLRRDRRHVPAGRLGRRRLRARRATRGCDEAPARADRRGVTAAPAPAGLTTRRSSPYQSLERILHEERCVVLDGGVATELQRIGAGEAWSQARLWGTWALYSAPKAVLDVHRAYAETGCQVISTNTWSILSAPEIERTRGGPELAHWMDVARAGVRLARQAVSDAGREGECAVAFAI